MSPDRIGRAVVLRDAQPSIVCDREQRYFGSRAVGGEVVCGPADDLRSGGELPVELGEREPAAAEDASLSQRRQQVRLVGVWSDAKDMLLAELISKFGGGEVLKSSLGVSKERP